MMEIHANCDCGSLNIAFTNHALQRCVQRVISPRYAELILAYGEPRKARDGAKKYFLTSDSMRDARKHENHATVQAIDTLRNKFAYIVVAGAKIITAAYGSRHASRPRRRSNPIRDKRGKL